MRKNKKVWQKCFKLFCKRIKMQYYGKNYKSLAKAIYKEDLKDILENEEWICVDIRMPEDFRRGHLRGARNITTKEELQEVLNQDKKILINCYLGHSASLLGTDLVEAGYLNIYYLDEAVANCL